jgi:3-oxoacyl-[acyl-carrier protein] reductase
MTSPNAAPVAIVTGAGKGIGRAVAVELGRAGYVVVAVARTQADVAETIALCANGGAALAADVSDLAEVQKVVNSALDQFGRVDAIVNNAGFAPVRKIEDMTEDEWRRVLETNLSATFYFSRAVWPIFKRQGGGVIVNMSSLASRDPFSGFFAYGAAKAGINLMGLDLARQGEPHGIRVHTIAPGAVETTMFRGLATEAQYPREKTLDPAEVARVIVACIRGDLAHTSGEVIWLHKRLG